MKKEERQNERTLKHLEMGYCKNDTESNFGQLLCYLNTMFCFEITATTNFESVLRNEKKRGRDTVWGKGAAEQCKEREEDFFFLRSGGTNKSQ